MLYIKYWEIEMTNLQEEMIDLQMRVAFQEDMLNQLNDIIAKQDTDLLLLREQVRALAQRLEELSRQPSLASANLPDERPPHY
jgi:SlyX protein